MAKTILKLSVLWGVLGVFKKVCHFKWLRKLPSTAQSKKMVRHFLRKNILIMNSKQFRLIR